MATETTTEFQTELYRRADGVEVWRIRDRSGAVVVDDVESDHDLQSILVELKETS